MSQLVKNLPTIWETCVWSLDGKIPWRRERLPTPVFWPREFHRLYSPWGRKESDTTEWHLLSHVMRRGWSQNENSDYVLPASTEVTTHASDSHRELKEINVFTVSLNLHLGLIWTEKPMGIFPNVSKYIELNNTKHFSGYVIRVKSGGRKPSSSRVWHQSKTWHYWFDSMGVPRQQTSGRKTLSREKEEEGEVGNHNQFNLPWLLSPVGKGSSLLPDRAHR